MKYARSRRLAGGLLIALGLNISIWGGVYAQNFLMTALFGTLGGIVIVLGFEL